ncbi:MAG TPA: radical SAM protein, partial [Anaerolineales bacterium]|nr:radical SAM protein [Anaerolineales bacterium]
MNAAQFSWLPDAPGPLYRLQGDEANLYYAPGYLLRVKRSSVPAVEQQLYDQGPAACQAGVDSLRAHSMQARQEWNELLKHAYKPQSLHLYLNQRCQLACRYCYSDLPELRDSAEISIDAIYAAASLVAKNCAEKNLPLVIVFHGGGEPVLSWRLIDRVQPELHRLADFHGIPLFRYLATNGVMSEQRAHWLAHSFDLVGLSIDGPPDIQTHQRPLRHPGGNSIPIILRTARILQESGCPVHVRVTLTAESASRQAEICLYLCENISPRSISVEPVYRGGRADSSMLLQEEQLDDFVKSFFEARVE